MDEDLEAVRAEWDEAAATFPREEACIEPLTDPMLWGRPVHDERYVMLSRS